MSYQMKYEYNEELDKDVLHLPLFRHVINMKGLNVEGNNYNNIRYADDTALLAGNLNKQNKRSRKTIWNEN